MSREVIFLAGFFGLCSGSVILEGVTARCSIPSCPSPPYGCRTYITKDDKGCSTGCGYSCGAPWCGARHCNQACNYGYIQDALGCNTCQCVSECKVIVCDKSCPSGYVLDDNKCPICECKNEFPSCLAFLICDQGLCPDSCKCQPDCFDAFPLPDNPVVFSLR